MNLEKDVLVLGIKKVSFTDDKNEQITGTQVWYQDINGVKEDKVIGFIPMKAWLPSDHFDAYSNLIFPIQGKVQLDIDLQKNKLKAVGFKFAK